MHDEASGYAPAAPISPYHWQGDTLFHRDGHTVAHITDFPQMIRARQHYMEVINRKQKNKFPIPDLDDQPASG